MANWLSLQGTYEGVGEAVFDDPEGTLRGPVRITFDEFGQLTIVMVVDSYECKREFVFGLCGFLWGEKPAEGGKGAWIGFGGGRQNLCRKLLVKTADGIFSAGPGLFYNAYESEEGAARLAFHPIKSQFDVTGCRRATCWVLPLANFISEFAQPSQEIADHPLRIRSAGQDTPTRLILFQFRHAPGFIEPLPDYEARKSALEAGQERTRVTAVMVGECAGQDIDALEKWFPFNFVPLLSLSTGIEVGAPWIEFRDDRGNLVRRLHQTLDHPPFFADGHAAFRERIHLGTGKLLTTALASEYFSQGFLRVAVRHAVMAGLHNRGLEEKLIDLVRALECVCDKFGLRVQRLLDGSSPETQERIKTILCGARDQIGRIAAGVPDERSRSRIRKISERAFSAKDTYRDFGISVVDLLHRLDLQDARMLDAYYRANARPDGRKWPDLLSCYRGVVVHEGYFNLDQPGYDIGDLLTVILHLHDVTIRVILKLLGYEGTYQPTVIPGTAAEPVDWVQPSIGAQPLVRRPLLASE
jgi:hypothetical protein